MSPRVKIPYPPCQLENMKARALLAVVAAAVLAQACADPRIPNCKHLNTKCCSKCYVGEENKPCDTDHFCLYQDPKGSEPMTLMTRVAVAFLGIAILGWAAFGATVAILFVPRSEQSAQSMLIVALLGLGTWMIYISGFLRQLIALFLVIISPSLLVNGIQHLCAGN